jgi:TonB family protein
MTKHYALFITSIALCAAPVAANAVAESDVVEKANGEFMFKHYPPRALAAGEEGQVGFRVTVDNEGVLTSCDITKSSGFMTLDAETCQFLGRYAQFKVPRAEDGRRAAATRTGYVNWKLPPDAKASPKVRTASLSTVPAPEKLICRRSVQTGSLVGRTKKCATQREWDQTERLAKESAQEAIGKGWKEDGT